MSKNLWIVLVIVVAWIAFLIGYGVSALTGVRQPGVEVTTAGGSGEAPRGPGGAAGGYGAARPAPAAAAGGYGSATVRQKPAAGGYGAPRSAPAAAGGYGGATVRQKPAAGGYGGPAGRQDEARPRRERARDADEE